MPANARRSDALNYRRPELQRSWKRYALAVVLSLVGVLLRAALQPIVGFEESLMLLIVPVVLSAWLGGFGPGIVATTLSLTLGTFLFIQPVFSVAITNPRDLTRVLLFLVEGVIISAIGRFQNRPRVLRREQLLRQQSELLDQAHEAMMVWELGGAIRFWNRGAEELYGWTGDEAIGQVSHVLLRTQHPMPLVDFEALLQREQQWTGEVMHTTRDGRQIITESRLTVVAQDDGSALVLETNRDISARQAAEAQLQAHSRKLQVLADASHAFAAAGADYQILLNQVAQRIAVELNAGCTIRLVSDDGDWLRTVASTHQDPALLEDIRASSTFADIPVASTHPIAQLLNERQQVQLQSFAPAAIRGQLPPEQLAILERVQMTSAVGGPLRVGGKPIGVISLARYQPTTTEFTIDEIHLLQDLADRAALAIENTRLFAQAQAAVQARDTMMATVSHDLRNPLGVIDGYTSVLGRRLKRSATFDPVAALDVVGKISHTTRRMNMLLGDLVDNARLGAGYALQIQRAPTDLVRLVEQIVAHYQSTTRTHTLTVTADVAQLSMSLDEPRIERVLGNLLSNAIKYSPSGGPIDIALHLADGDAARWAVIAVTDRGVGIPPGDLPHLFKDFHRAANVGAISGTGIGLASARHIVEQHGGQITVESTPAAGSTFTVRLPLAAEQQNAGASEPPDQARASIT